jgi:hypothetical protein
MKLVISLLTLGMVGVGGWYAWHHTDSFSNLIQNGLPASVFQTMEVRFTADEIMQAHKKELLKNQDYTYLDPKTLYYPHLLMEVKYAKGRGATGEGSLLWGLYDGEIVTHTATWEKTHGYEDCLVAKADKNDFKIIEAVVSHGGTIDREKLYNLFNIDQEVLDTWIENCREKKLIAVGGHKFRLHLQNPLLQMEPITIFDQPLVTQPSKNCEKIHGHYSAAQIRKMAESAFGSDFAIRRTEEVYLPIYAILVQNPDGTILTTYWNALNGKKMNPPISR